MTSLVKSISEFGFVDQSILVVDDDVGVLKAIKRLLNRSFRHVCICSDVDSALEWIEKKNFAVVLSDQNMPGMKGCDLLNRVGEISPATSRILITGNADVECLDNAINTASVDSFVKKPWNNSELSQLVVEGIQRYEQRMGEINLDDFVSEANVGVAIIDASYVVLKANYNLSILTGYRSDEMSGMNICDLSGVKESNWNAFLYRTGSWNANGWVTHKYGRPISLGLCVLNAGVTVGENRYVCLFIDIENSSEPETVEEKKHNSPSTDLPTTDGFLDYHYYLHARLVRYKEIYSQIIVEVACLSGGKSSLDEPCKKSLSNEIFARIKKVVRDTDVVELDATQGFKILLTKCENYTDLDTICQKLRLQVLQALKSAFDASENISKGHLAMSGMICREAELTPEMQRKMLREQMEQAKAVGSNSYRLV